MRWLFNLLRGMVTLQVTVPFPERFVNLCAQENLEFWAMDWLDEHTVRLTARRRHRDRILELAGQLGGEGTVERSRGLPDFLARFRTRHAFLVGLGFALVAVLVLSRFVLTIEVTGNEQVPTGVILSQLRLLGVHPGVYGPALERKQLAQDALVELPELSFMALNLHGTRLEVIVREVVEAPERVDVAENIDLAAQAGGLILKVAPELGDSLVKAGDTVAEGDILISGTVTMEPPLYSDAPTRYFQTHARGRVWARTWRTLTAAIPLTAQGKDYTGREASCWSLTLFGRRIEIFGTTSISWPKYDKITTVRQLPLDISLQTEVFREYESVALPLDQQAAQAMLEQRLMDQLHTLIGEDGTVSASRYEARVEGETLAVTLYAECREEITTEQPGRALSEFQGAQAPTG